MNAKNEAPAWSSNVIADEVSIIGNMSTDMNLSKGVEYFLTGETVKQSFTDKTGKVIEYYCFEICEAKNQDVKSLVATSHFAFRAEDEYVSNLHEHQYKWKTNKDVIDSLKGIAIKFERTLVLPSGDYTRNVKQFSIKGKPAKTFKEVDPIRILKEEASEI